MTLTRFFTPAAVALAITMAAGPALAQSGGNDRERRARDRSPRATDSGNQNRGAGRDQSGKDVAVRRTEPRTETSRGNIEQDRGRPSGNRGYEAEQYNNRGGHNRSDDNGRVNSQRYDDRRNDNRGYGWNAGYDRSSWRFRVRFGLGISIFAGRPFAFRFDYGWRPRFTYHYSMRPGVAYGGMSFLLDPDYAEVYIDGEFVGLARDFGGQPVPVAMGSHRIELYAQGFEPVAFDINVLPGQVIPYRGSLYPVY